MRVEIVRSGGLAGVRLRSVVDTRELAGDAAAQTESGLASLPFGRPASTPSHPDAFQYHIRVLDNGAKPTVVLDESEVPNELQGLIDNAMARADIAD
jgi:hypothetical protein